MRLVPSRVVARELGLHPKAYANEGRIQSIKTASGQRRYDVDSYIRESAGAVVACYCRVSSRAQRDDLARQVAVMLELHPGAEIVADIGGGLNFRRKGLVALLERLHGGAKLRLVVAHKDRLARFGFDLIRWQIERNGGEIVALGGNDHSPEQELTKDILAILHTFSCRLYGLRRYRKVIEEDQDLSHAGANGDPEPLA